MKKFNKDKYLKQLKFKRFYRKYERYFYIGIPCLLVGILGIYFAYSKFTTTADEEVVKTTVGDFLYGDVIINNYVNGQYVVDAPAKATGYKVDKIVCDNGAVGEWSGKDWGPTITNVTRRSKCNIYFVDSDKINIGNLAVPLDYYGKCPAVNADGTATVTEAENTYGYLCSMKDAYGTSYYYRGNVTNNYVKFGAWADDTPDVFYGYYSTYNDFDYKEYSSLEECQSASSYNKNCTLVSIAGKDMYWRILRINGDGTVRVIYDGTSAHANGESSKDRQIGTSAFNGGYTDNAYVGYMYNINIIDDSTYENNAGGLEKYEFYISKTYSYDKGVFNLDNPIKINGKNLTDSYVGYYFAGYWNLVASSSELGQILAVHNSPTNVNVEYSVVSAKSESKETAQTNSRNSAIKTYLDTWYENNIKGTTNEQYIADNLFCNDRSFAPNNSGTGAGESKTYYRWSNFPGDRYNNKMMLTCPQKNDAFTVSDTTNGNGVLTYGVGLVTTDEVVLAGGWSSSNSKYYLYSGQNYWTMSPNNFNDNYADERRVLSSGDAGNSTGYGYNVGDAYGARPVFNLKAEVLSQGTGTASDPYHLAS